MSLWNSLEFLHKINSILIISWVIISAVFGILSWKIQSRISKLNISSEKELKAKVEDTESKARKFENKLSESELLRIETENKLKQEIEKTNKKIKPPTLSLVSNDVQKIGDTLVCTLLFKSSKNQPLGTIQLVAQLPIGSKSEIIDFWPTTSGGAFQAGPDSKQISKDKKYAQLIYSLMGAGSPTVELKLTESSLVRIQGNYIPNPIQIEAK